MVQGVIFDFKGKFVEVRVDKTDVLFRTGQFASALAPIDSIKLDKSGCIKEFPDLKERRDWRKESISRFKEKVKKLPNETDRMKYIMSDLQKHGYVPIYLQRDGFRTLKIKKK